MQTIHLSRHLGVWISIVVFGTQTRCRYYDYYDIVEGGDDDGDEEIVPDPWGSFCPESLGQKVAPMIQDKHGPESEVWNTSRPSFFFDKSSRRLGNCKRS